jgi:hypothetical protein
MGVIRSPVLNNIKAVLGVKFSAPDWVDQQAALPAAGIPPAQVSIARDAELNRCIKRKIK